MGSSRLLGAGLVAALPLACGAGLVVALQHRLYACAVVLSLAGLWAAAHAAWAARPRAPSPAAIQPPPAAASAEADLRLVRSLLDQTPAPLIIGHPGGALSAGNRAARRLFQVDDRLVRPPAALSDALAEGRGGRRLTVRLDTPDGPHVYAVSLADLVGPRGPVRLAILIDIQPEIRAAEAAALRELMKVLSHEIMNALTPVASLAATAPPVQAVDAVATLARRAEGLMRFVEAYRSLARLPEPALAKVSLGALLDEAAQLFHGRWDARGVRLEVIRPQPDIRLDLDLDLMVHALTNILSNAAEAALETGRADPAVTLAAHLDEGAARVVIEDNGAGVSLEDPEAIFRPFFTTKPQGSGVGLSFARQVALSHGGSLTLAPASPGRGARFVLAV